MGVDMNSVSSIKVDSNVKIQETQDQQKQTENVKSLDQSSQVLRKDSLQLSEEGKKLQAVQAQAQQGYYNSPEVMAATAVNISNAMPKGSLGE
jgi:hypothetical protein